MLSKPSDKYKRNGLYGTSCIGLENGIERKRQEQEHEQLPEETSLWLVSMEATIGGKLDIESQAFDKKYPAQVGFGIVNNCYPLPKSIFKSAIYEKYKGCHKFKQELAPHQPGIIRVTREKPETFRVIRGQPVKNPISILFKVLWAFS
ncbi:hypothetical protein YC2023_072711 [Brassica napus]